MSGERWIWLAVACCGFLVGLIAGPMSTVRLLIVSTLIVAAVRCIVAAARASR